MASSAHPAARLAALYAAARAARPRAYAPYSRFHVGAAVLDERGRVHAGCNVENAAYPQGLCAEASALAAMVLAGGRRARAVAVAAALSASGELTTPCGGCRQKIAEFAAPDCEVHVLGPRGMRRVFMLGELLPFGFGEGHLPAQRGAKAPPAIDAKSTTEPLSQAAPAARPSAARRRRG
ncbi:MAG: cytidine deaminase [Rubrivivax sp.]|nr:cytidine deaminase [Rubrivivax sp.]